MKTATLLLLMVWIVIAAVAALNWSAFSSISDLSLGISTIHLPLAVVLLAPALLVSALFLASLVYLQAGAHLQSRRHTRELQATRVLAESAEASRLASLRSFLEGELAQQAKSRTELRNDVFARVDRLEQDLRSAVEQAGNTLAAYIGELGDHLDKGGPA